jgi:hypothetical protein
MITIILVTQDGKIWHGTRGQTDGRTWVSAYCTSAEQAARETWEKTKAIEKEYPGTFDHYNGAGPGP